MYWET